MGRYAEKTQVPVAKSKTDIEDLLARHGCDQFMSGTDRKAGRAVVQFTSHNRRVKFEIGLPDRDDPAFTEDRRGWVRSESGITKVIEQEERQRWRALLLVIRAKLEAVESGIATFEDEFMAHIMLPNQQTVGEVVQPLIDEAYSTGQMPKALPART